MYSLCTSFHGTNRVVLMNAARYPTVLATNRSKVIYLRGANHRRQVNTLARRHEVGRSWVQILMEAKFFSHEIRVEGYLYLIWVKLCKICTVVPGVLLNMIFTTTLKDLKVRIHSYSQINVFRWFKWNFHHHSMNTFWKLHHVISGVIAVIRYAFFA